MTDDFYCDEVLSGRTWVEKVIETPTVLAFRHTSPYYRYHVVVIPKRHIESFLTATPADYEMILELLSVVQQVAQQMVTNYGGAHIVTNVGKYQTSKHLHWHVGAGEPVK